MSWSKWNYPESAARTSTPSRATPPSTVDANCEFPIIQGHENVGTVAAIGSETETPPTPTSKASRSASATASSSAPTSVAATATTAATIFPTTAANAPPTTATISAPKIRRIFSVAGRSIMYIVPGSFLVKVPDDLPSEVAVLAEIFAVSVGLDRAKQMSAFPNESFRFDDTVVVLGIGPLGMCFLMKARMLGAGTIIAVDLSDFRLELCEAPRRRSHSQRLHHIERRPP